MTPFLIDVDTLNYTVVKDTGKYDKDNQLITSNEGYYSSLDGALRKIVTEKTKLKHDGDIVLLKDYLKSLKDMTKLIMNLNLK